VKTPAALIVHSGSSVVVGGLTLTERSILQAHRAGFDPIAVWGPHLLPASSLARLAARGVHVAVLSPEHPPLSGPTVANEEGGVVIVGPNVLLGATAALTDLVARGTTAGSMGPAVAMSAAGTPLMAYVPADLVPAIATHRSLESMVGALTAVRPANALPQAGRLLRRVDPTERRAAVERELIRHTNGNESYFTKKIRRFSVPFSIVLTRLRLTPTQVTSLGFLVALASSWCIAQGEYLWGVAGGLLCYASMVFDCSDGEVARLSLRDSAFGAWLETVVDYTTYGLLLAALVVAVDGTPHETAYRSAATIALIGSLVVAGVAGYLRHRVAAADPGQFDDASAEAMGSTGFHRFARWGRQWIKRSSIAHLVLALSLVNLLPVLLFLWAFGASVAAVVIVAVEPFVVRKVKVTPARVPPLDPSDREGVRSCP